MGGSGNRENDLTLASCCLRRANNWPPIDSLNNKCTSGSEDSHVRPWPRLSQSAVTDRVNGHIELHASIDYAHISMWALYMVWLPPSVCVLLSAQVSGSAHPRACNGASVVRIDIKSEVGHGVFHALRDFVLVRAELAHLIALYIVRPD